MDIQDSSIPKPSPEVRIDLSSEDMTIDQACQDNCKTTRDCNEESNPMALQPSEIQGDSNPAEPPPDCNEESNPMAPQPSEIQGDSNLAEPPPVKPKPVVDEKYRLLFEAAVKGDWKSAEEILNGDPDAITATLLTTEGDDATVLDIAAMARQDQLVENLVNRVRTENKAPTLRCALYHAAQRGRIRRTKELVDELDKVNAHGVDTAFCTAPASALRHKEVVWYLATHTKSVPKYFTVVNLILAGHLDILLYLAKKYPDLMTSEQSVFEGIGNIKSYYRSGAQLNFWEKCIYQCIPPLVDTSFDNAKDTKMEVDSSFDDAKDMKMAQGKIAHRMLRVVPFVNRIRELKLRHECWLELSNLVFKGMKYGKETPEILQSISDIVLRAASSGIFEIVKLCLKQYPELMWDEEFTIQLIEEVVKARHVELFRLLNAYVTIPTHHDLMPAVVEWSLGYVPADVSGSAFLMQRELQWFEVLEDRSSPLLQGLRFEMKVMKDESDPSSTSLELQEVEKGRGKTYREVFVEQRKDLLQEAGQWMKDTSSSCSLVATLIITVAFAAAFTVPGGNDNTGTPIFLKKTSFTVFAIADALALFSSITATLMFLAILTSRYAAKDFLHSLPRKMILGLTFLFLSLAFMLVAFGSALTIILSERWKWIYIPITLWAAVPVIMFAILQLPLYVEMVESTFFPRLYRPMKIWK